MTWETQRSRSNDARFGISLTCRIEDVVYSHTYALTYMPLTTAMVVNAV